MIADLEAYEGAFCEREEPGYHVIEKEGVDIIKIPRLELVDKVLHCEFEVLGPNLQDSEVEELVYLVLLARFCDDYYADKAEFVAFLNLQTTAAWRTLYLF